MTDTVLQSFCERCGTRYTFTEQETPRESGLTKIGRSLGLRGAPKPPGEPNISTALPTHDPFKATFHFCLECRQYTCQNCWNPDAGFCQTCYPIGEVDLRAAERAASAEARAASPASAISTAVGGKAGASVAGQPAAGPWPTSDLDRAARSTAPSSVTSPTTERADGPSPWGPGIADAPSTTTWGGAGEADGDVGGAPVDPQRGQESVAAAILRDAGGLATAPSPDDAAVWASQAAPPDDDGADADAAPTQVMDPWRGVVFSHDQPAVEVTDIVASAPQPDPDLPWLAKSDASQAEPAAEVLDETAIAEEEAREIDHRGWIAGSTIAAGAAWSRPVPEWPDEATAASAVEAAAVSETDAWTTAEPTSEVLADPGSEAVADPGSEAVADPGSEGVADPAAAVSVEPGTDSLVADEPDAAEASPWVDSIVDADAVDGRVDASVDAWMGIAALRATTRDMTYIDKAHAIDDGLGIDGSTDGEASAEGSDQDRGDVEWPAVDTLATVGAIDDGAPPVATTSEPARLDPIVAAAAAGAVIAAADVAGPVEPALPPWIPPEPPTGGSAPPVSTGPFANSSPLAPQPPLAAADAVPPYTPPPQPPPAAPGFAAAAAPIAPMEQPLRPLDAPLPPPMAPPPMAPPAPPPPMAPPPPLAMAAPPPAQVGLSAQHPTFVAPPPPMAGVGLQANAGAVPPAASMPSAQAPGPAGQTKAHPCQSCGLPLSAKARFCRRCGAQQAG